MIHRPYELTLMVVVVLAAPAQAQTFTTLYNFAGGLDGGYSDAGVVEDPAGNLYGTTAYGGGPPCPQGCGVVFKLDTAGTETVLHSFTGYPLDGIIPHTPVVRDRAGNFYGTTLGGGAAGWGAVFKIDTARNERVLYSFAGRSDGMGLYQGLVLDQSGTMFGTAVGDNGTIFKLDSAGKFTLLHTFTGAPTDGAYPFFGHLTMDKSGNLYGVTSMGGAYGYGVLYKLSRKGTFTLLHSFKGRKKDGCFPYGSVVQNNAGNLLGTTYKCGAGNLGTIWKVSKTGKEIILHNFAGGTTDGCFPEAGLTRDSKGNLYGVTSECGIKSYGTLYKLSAKGKLTVLHGFGVSDGAYPVGEVLRTSKGTLFGTTEEGAVGSCEGFGCGTVWSYVP